MHVNEGWNSQNALKKTLIRLRVPLKKQPYLGLHCLFTPFGQVLLDFRTSIEVAHYVHDLFKSLPNFGDSVDPDQLALNKLKSVFQFRLGLPRLRNLVNVYTSSTNRNDPVYTELPDLIFFIMQIVKIADIFLKKNP